MKEIKLNIIAVNKVIFSDFVKSLTAPGDVGSLGILYNHAPIVTSLSKGACKIISTDETQENIEISGGLMSVKNNKVTILVA